MNVEMAGDDVNVARLVERLQLGASAGRHRRVRRLQKPLPLDSGSVSSSLASVRRQLLLPRFRSAGAFDATRHRVDRWGQPRAPVFQLAFANAAATSHLLAAVDEDGDVSVFDTRAVAAEAAPTTWTAHRNAVFDVIWSRDDRQLVTAAGDLHLRGWDAETKRPVFALAGHRMSVKCVRQKDASSTFASGARDGHVILWDTRLPCGGTTTGSGKPVGVLPSVHAAPVASAAPATSRPNSAQRQLANSSFLSPAASARKKRRPSALNRPAPPRSVTCVEFTPDGRELVTAGAVDSVVKFWDLRHLAPFSAIDAVTATNGSHSLAPTRQIDCGSRGGAQRGVSALSFGRSGATLLVSVHNDAIKVVDVLAPSAYSTSSVDLSRSSVLLECVGHAATSFYVKAAFSPDDEFIVGGSADGAVYIWDASASGGRAHSRSFFQPEEKRVAERRLPLFALKGHESDVNGVAWSRQDFFSIASGSDDGTVRYWRADREDPSAERREGVINSQRQSENPSFSLRESATAGRGWKNWKEFLEQPDGVAYPITAAACGCQSEDESEVKRSADVDARKETTPVSTASDASPMVIRRSGGLSGQRHVNRRRQRAPTPETDARDDAGASRVRARTARRRIASVSTAAASTPTPASTTGTRQQATLFDCWKR